MSNLPQSTALLRHIVRRVRTASAARLFFVALLSLSAAYAVVLLVSRLTGLVSLQAAPGILAALPVAAGLVALVRHRRPTCAEAARHMDRHAGTKDLFLTVALLDDAAGEFRPLVTRDAEAKAGSIDPAAVVPFRWMRRFAVAAALLAVLAAGEYLLPQLDPFGRVAASEQVEQKKRELAESRKATQARTAVLRREPEGEHSEAVEQALERLTASLRKMKPVEKRQNLDILSERQKELAAQWQRLSTEKLKNLLKQTGGRQQFGGADREKLERWTRELQEGSAGGLKRELDELKEKLRQLAKTEDPVKRAEMMQQVKKRLRDLEQFASDRAGSQALAASLERALEQLELSKIDGLSDEALQALGESLELSELELEQLAQSVEDLEALEEALRLLQQARLLNDYELLDGEACAGCDSLAEYAELYGKLCRGRGLGMRGPGIGEGGAAPEDDQLESGFQTERSRSPITAGKVLLSLKTKGLSDRGEAVKAYRENLTRIKQTVNEAIDQEQIPPGYHEGIKGYFDTIEAP